MQGHWKYCSLLPFALCGSPASLLRWPEVVCHSTLWKRMPRIIHTFSVSPFRGIPFVSSVCFLQIGCCYLSRGLGSAWPGWKYIFLPMGQKYLFVVRKYYAVHKILSWLMNQYSKLFSVISLGMWGSSRSSEFRHSENYFPIASLVCWIPDRRLSVMIATAEFNFSDSHASTSFSVCSSLCTYIGSTRCGGRWMMSKHNVHMQCMWLRGSWGPHFAQVCSAVKAAAVWCMHYTAKYWAPLLWTLWQLAGFL